LTGVFGQEKWGKLRTHHGESSLFKLAVSVIASPFIDPVTSTIALFRCVQEFGIDSLLFDGRFPGCLLVPKTASFFEEPKQLSVIDSLIEGLRVQDEFCYFVLIHVLNMFPLAPLYAAVDMSLDELPGDLEQVLNVRHLIVGEVTASQLILEFQSQE
jgi:hypothetical protein